MTTDYAADQGIEKEIERLREQFADTQDLYREVCVLLFFRHGITPTANKLYQLVRKGSMSAPAEALRQFWEDLREKSRIRIEHPDLPESLKMAAGEIVATLWNQAQTAAKDGLTFFYTQAQEKVQEAENEKIIANREKAAVLEKLMLIQQSANITENRALQLERELAAAHANNEALSTQLITAGQQQISLESALADARHDFTAELEKLRIALQLSEERCNESEKRALLEIDRARTNADKLQKELSQSRKSHSEALDQCRTENSALQRDLGNTLQKLGTAEGVLQEMRTTNQSLITELQSLRAAALSLETQHLLLTRDLEVSQNLSAALTQELEKLRSPKPNNRRFIRNNKID